MWVLCGVYVGFVWVWYGFCVRFAMGFAGDFNY